MREVPRHLVCASLLLGASLGDAAELRSPGMAPAVLNQRLQAANPPLVIDVRSPSEYASGHVPGAVNRPAPTVTRHLEEIRRAPEAVLYCNDRRFTAVAEQLLAKAKVRGFSHLEGGLTAWREHGLPLERSLPE